MARYLAFAALGAKSCGLTEESNRAGAAAQLLQWVCDQKNPSSEHLDNAYQQTKSAFRQLKKEFPDLSMNELLDLLPGYMMDQTLRQMAEQQPAPESQSTNE